MAALPPFLRPGRSRHCFISEQFQHCNIAVKLIIYISMGLKGKRFIMIIDESIALIITNAEIQQGAAVHITAN